MRPAARPDLEAQIETLTVELEMRPRDAEFLLRRGDLHRRHEDHDSAQRDFAAAREADPGHPWLDLYAGRLDLEAGDAQSAVKVLGRYLETKPDHALADGLADRARALFDTAPDGLLKLPDWTGLGELLECLHATGACESRARARLEQAIADFRAEWSDSRDGS